MLRAIPFLSRCVLLIGVLSSSTAGADRAAEDAHLKEIRAIRTGDTPSTWRAIEQKALARSEGRASRAGSELTLTLENGSKARFENHEKECLTGDVDRCRMFYLEAYLPTRRLFVVYVGLYEGGTYLLIDHHTGTQTAVSGTPKFGPDPDLILVIDDDVAYGSGQELQLWRRVADGHALEWAWEPADERHHIDLVGWEMSTKLLLNFRVFEAPSRQWPATLEKRFTDWHLEMAPVR